MSMRISSQNCFWESRDAGNIQQQGIFSTQMPGFCFTENPGETLFASGKCPKLPLGCWRATRLKWPPWCSETRRCDRVAGGRIGFFGRSTPSPPKKKPWKEEDKSTGGVCSFFLRGETPPKTHTWIASCDCFFSMHSPQKPATVSGKKRQLGYLAIQEEDIKKKRKKQHTGGGCSFFSGGTPKL